MSQTSERNMLLELLKRALPAIEAGEQHYAHDCPDPRHDELAKEASGLYQEIVDVLLARDIKPFDEYENPEEAVTDENAQLDVYEGGNQ